MTITWLGILLSLLFSGTSVFGQSPCEACLRASQEEFQRCLDNALSEEDKTSCGEDRDAQAKICENNECETERESRR